MGLPFFDICSRLLASLYRNLTELLKSLLELERGLASTIPVKTAILACHAFHARRALLYYQAAMPDVRFLVCPAPTPGYAREDWYLTEKGRARVLGEVQRLGGQVSEVFAMMLQGK